MRKGVVLANQGATVPEVAELIETAELLGFDSAWMPGIPNGPDVLTLLALAGSSTSRIELGPAIVATAPRHPVALASQALTVNDALGGRLTLGIGASHQRVVEGLWGLPYDRPALRMREYLSVLVPLLAHQDVRFAGELMSTTYRLDATRSEFPRPAVFIAALGPRMLAVGATCSSGVATWMVGPRTLETSTVPTANDAAVAAALPAPRILASLPFLLTNVHDTARDLANTEFALYAKLPVQHPRPMSRSSVPRSSSPRPSPDWPQPASQTCRSRPSATRINAAEPWSFWQPSESVRSRRCRSHRDMTARRSSTSPAPSSSSWHRWCGNAGGCRRC